jgi:acyl carrier protein
MYESRDQFKHALIDFIAGPIFLRHAKLTRAMRIDGTTPLFDTGIIDSLGIVDLLAFVESAIGTAVPMRKVDMRYFGTVDRICQSFWTDPEGDRP